MSSRDDELTTADSVAGSTVNLSVTGIDVLEGGFGEWVTESQGNLDEESMSCLVVFGGERLTATLPLDRFERAP